MKPVEEPIVVANPMVEFSVEAEESENCLDDVGV